MRFLLRPLFAVLLLVPATLIAAVDDPPDVSFPDPVLVPQVMPSGGQAVVLLKDEWYVFTQDKPGFVTATPPGIVDIETNARPEGQDGKKPWFKLKGTFAGGGGKVQTRTYTNDIVYVVSPIKDGTTYLTYTPVGATSEKQQKSRAVEVRMGQAPQPPPPGPVPPVPPVPVPTTFNPFGADGFRVLIVYNATTFQSMPAAQKQIFDNAQIRQYVNTHCARGEDGKTPEFRQYPSDSNLSNEYKTFQLAYARPRTSDSWVVMSDGKTGMEGPLPASVENMMNLLKKYGGP